MSQPKNQNTPFSLEINIFNSKTWGPLLWQILHTIAAGYPKTPEDEYKDSCKQFFYSLCFLLPCPTCRFHYSELILKNEPKVNSSIELQKWVLWIHNQVNQRLKSGKIWSLKDLQSKYPPQDLTEFLYDNEESDNEELDDDPQNNEMTHNNKEAKYINMNMNETFSNKIEPYEEYNFEYNYGRSNDTRDLKSNYNTPPMTKILNKTEILQNKRKLPPSSVKKITNKRKNMLNYINNQNNVSRQFGVPGTKIFQNNTQSKHAKSIKRNVPKSIFQKASIISKRNRKKKKKCNCGK